MDNLVNLTEFLVKKLVKEPELVSVKLYVEDEINVIEILVSKDDMGAVIGKGGNIANSIRVIVRAANKNREKFKINFESF
ncbi:MAG: KH domain-containing protein [Mycoplasmatota bacterium]